MIGSALRSFARLLGVSDEHAEDALHSERAAMQVTRRGFFGVVGAMAGASVFSFGAAEALDGYEHRLAWGGTLNASKPGSLTLARFDALLKERYSEPAVAYLNPRDYAMLKTWLNDDTEGIVVDKYVPPGQAFMMPAPRVIE